MYKDLVGIIKEEKNSSIKLKAIPANRIEEKSRNKRDELVKNISFY